MSIKLYISNKSHTKYAKEICETIEGASKQRGTGIAKRDPKYIEDKLTQGKSAIALDGDKLVGFCYIESWQHEKYVATSGLIIKEEYRGKKLGLKLKLFIVNLAIEKFPNAKLFGITTSLPVMKINSQIGYKPVTFSELTTDTEFWEGCKGCKNYDILIRNDHKMCLCTGMILDKKRKTSWKHKLKHFNRLQDYFKKRR